MDAAIKRIEPGGARVTLKAPLKTPSDVLEEDGVPNISKLKRELWTGPITALSKTSMPKDHRKISMLVQFPRYPGVEGRYQIQWRAF